MEIGQATKQILLEAMSAAPPNTKRHAALAETARMDNSRLGNAVVNMLRERPRLLVDGWCTIGKDELTKEEIRNYIGSGDAAYGPV